VTTVLTVSPAATWDAVLGQTAAVRIITSALAQDQLAHAWLLVGPSGVGQREAARALAGALNCPVSDDATRGCGACSTCERIVTGAHPAVLDFAPEGQQHVVDAVRSEWIPTATRTMTEGRRKVLRIVAADRMNEGAQNAFLKVLEEPPPSVVWILDVEEEGALLDTIVSRCRRVDFLPWTPEALATLAATLRIPDDQRAALVRAAMGSPDRLRDLADPELARARWDHLAIVDQLAERGPGAVVPMAKELVAWAKSRSKALKSVHAAEMEGLEAAYGVDNGQGWPPGVRARLTKRFERLERQEQRRALDMLLGDVASYLRDLLAVTAGAPEATIVNLDHLGALQRDAVRLQLTDVIAGLAAIERCREALDRNGAPELQIERLLLALSLPLYRP
jgi:DNA polymerase-3 subunit delta'